LNSEQLARAKGQKLDDLEWQPTYILVVVESSGSSILFVYQGVYEDGMPLKKLLIPTAEAPGHLMSLYLNDIFPAELDEQYQVAG
jgi:hypothetical protein